MSNEIPRKGESIFSPSTNRMIKVGGRTWMNLVKHGLISGVYSNKPREPEKKKLGQKYKSQVIRKPVVDSDPEDSDEEEDVQDGYNSEEERELDRMIELEISKSSKKKKKKVEINTDDTYILESVEEESSESENN
jgi:hypothetical protein